MTQQSPIFEWATGLVQSGAIWPSVLRSYRRDRDARHGSLFYVLRPVEEEFSSVLTYREAESARRTGTECSHQSG